MVRGEGWGLGEGGVGYCERVVMDTLGATALVGTGVVGGGWWGLWGAAGEGEGAGGGWWWARWGQRRWWVWACCGRVVLGMGRCLGEGALGADGWGGGRLVVGTGGGW